MDIRRRELKYIMTEADAIRREQRLARVIGRDENDSGRGYTVRSLYFDTPYDRDYADKAEGLLNRRKIRLRTYDNSGKIRLELKEKSTNTQRKRAVIVSRAEADALCAGRYEVLLEREEALCAELYAVMTKLAYRPKCVVEYDRRAFAEPCNDIRITFDRNIRVCTTGFRLTGDDLFFLPADDRNRVTMEVKFNGFLLSHIAKAAGATQDLYVSASKYSGSRELIH
ncbi:MAG: polyphosphate polymerase domain-containing protein [Lachnospiraceae bacterium]|nr:polyphosphate polymerase domain-containing protein [Lachnospiraceae bacterium]